MSSKLKSLRDRRAEVIAAGEAVVRTYTDEDRDPTDNEIAELEAIADKRDRLDTEIDAAERRADLERTFSVTDHDGRGAISITGGKPRLEDDPKRGFKHFGEFAQAVYRASAPGARPADERLLIGAAPTSYGTTGTGADGGYLVPTEFSNRIHELALAGDSLLPLTDNLPISGNSIRVPADETTPWGSSGVLAYWKEEAAQATQTKPSLKSKDLRLQTLIALVPMSAELMSDTSAAGTYLERKSADAIRWKTNDAFINGTGAGQPLGVANAGSLVTVAKEGSQAADTINANNIGKMYGRCLMPQNAVWHVAPDAYNQLITMTIGDQPVFTLPAAGLTAAPNGMLLGRPVRIDHSCQTLGDLGDIYLVNWRDGYLTISKAGETVDTETSIHLWFDYATDAFRAMFRVDGQPWLNSAVTAANGSSTYSHCVTLAARA